MNYIKPKAKVLLLNPEFGGKLVIKDQYCSFTSKAGYYWLPVDLLILSGNLSGDFDVKVIDAVVENFSEYQMIEEITKFAPNFIVCLSSLITHHKDRALIATLKNMFQFDSCFIGDVFYFKPEIMIKFPEVDSILFEFPSDHLGDFFKTGDALENIIYKSGNKIVSTPRKKDLSVNYKTPQHNLFKLNKYTVPFMKDKLCASIFTNFGCKFQCNYCPASSVSYRERSLTDISLELEYLKSQNIKNLWLRDFTFGLNYKTSIEFLDLLSLEDFRWFCSSRAEVLKPDLIKKMADAGCYLVAIGVDMISEKTNKAVKRNQKNDVLKSALKNVSESKIHILVHLLVGAPGESYMDMLKSIHFISFSSATFLSINFFSPRAGSDYFNEETIEANNQEQLDSYHGNSFLLSTIKLYALCLFYFNPLRILKILLMIDSADEFKTMLKTGLNLFLPDSKESTKYKLKD